MLSDSKLPTSYVHFRTDKLGRLLICLSLKAALVAKLCFNLVKLNLI